MAKETHGKRLTIVGYKQLADVESGDLIDCQVAMVEDKDVNFQKFWLSNILYAVDEMSNKKMKVLFYLFEQALKYRGNIIPKSINEIVKDTGYGKSTVQRTLNILEEHGVIRRKKSGGMVFINPDVIFRGGRNQRQAVLIEYAEWKQQELPFPEPENQEDRLLSTSASQDEQLSLVTDQP